MNRTPWVGSAVLLAAAVLVALAGCQPPVAPPPADPSVPVAPSTPVAPSRPVRDVVRDDGGATRRPSETWELLRIQSTRVGHQFTRTETVEEDNRSVVRISGEQRLSLRRFDQSTEQKMESMCVETPEGALLRFETRETSGRETTVTTGVVNQGKLSIASTTGGKTERLVLDWPHAKAGWYAVDQSLRQQPLKPGEKRQLSTLTPVLNQVATVNLEALDYESTTVVDASQRLLKIRRKDLVAGQELESWIWTDAAGEVLKTMVLGIGLESHRCSKEEALVASSSGSFDFGNSTVVRLRTNGKDPHQAQRVVYLARIDGGNPARVFTAGGGQAVEPVDDESARITVVAVRPGTAIAEVGTPPTDEDRLPNNWIQSDDPAIRSLAAEAVGGETDPWKQACLLELFVRDRVQHKNFSQAFLSASEVARSREGDCTEHAVLLAALCRAQGLSARVAIGLVYYPPANGFAYHMWNEVWIDDRWIPIDGTLGKGGIGGGHLRLATSHLQGSDSRTVFLPVAQVLGRLTLDVVEMQEK